MGISRMPRSEWVKIDRKYVERINRRKYLLKNEQPFCVGSDPVARPAIEELYEEIMINQLPKRFPNMFTVKRGTFTNHVTGCRYSVDFRRLADEYMLNTLAENVEEDFYFMVPDGDGEYRLQAYSSCFPQGLLSSAKMGLSVREIHQPVPGYESRLGNGVDRHFRRMEPGVFVGRLNVSNRYAEHMAGYIADILSIVEHPDRRRRVIQTPRQKYRQPGRSRHPRSCSSPTGDGELRHHISPVRAPYADMPPEDEDGYVLRAELLDTDSTDQGGREWACFGRRVRYDAGEVWCLQT